MIRVQKRDEDFLRGLSKFGVLSTAQIAAWYFESVDKRTVLRRLRLLETHGLILNPSTLPNGMKAWSLSKVGASLVSAPMPFRYSNRNSTHHDVTLSGLRKHLEDIGISKDWTSDMDMKRELGRNEISDGIVPDGLFLTQIFNKEDVVALELELHPKSHKRYRSIFHDYAYKNAISHIFYVVQDKSILKPIASSWVKFKKYLRFPSEQKLLICVLGELLECPDECLVYVPSGTRFPIKDVFTSSQNCPRAASDFAHPLGDRAALGVGTSDNLKSKENQRLNAPTAM